MNPLTNVKNINKINEREAELGISSKSSWHQQYRDSAYIFIGGLPYDLTEGDIICVFSQYGEIVNINLVRDKKSGKSKGYCFIAYEDQRSTILAVDNLNGIKLLGRTLRVDHVAEYRKPKEDENDDDVTQKLRQEGCAPRTPSPSASEKEEEPLTPPLQEKDSSVKKSKKKVKKEKKKKNKKEKVTSSSSDSETEDNVSRRGKVKKGKHNYPSVQAEKQSSDERNTQRHFRDPDSSNRDHDKTSLRKSRDWDKREDSSSRHRNEDRERTFRDSGRDRERGQDNWKERERRDRYESSDRRDRDRNRDKQDRDRDGRDRSRDSERHRDSGRDRDSTRDRDRDSERYRDRDSGRDRDRR